MKYLFRLSVVFLLFPASVSLAQTPKLTRGPYLQVVTPTSVIIRWRTDQPTTGRVWFGQSTNSLTNTLTESQPTLDHSLTLTGLQPASRYAYAIGYDDTQLISGPDYFAKTAPPKGDTRPIRMWVLGDFGNGSDNQKAVYQAYRNATATVPADLWVWLGDNAYSFGKEEEFNQWVFPLYAPTLRNTPSFITPGNHDYADSNTNFDIAYYKLFSFPQQGEAGGVPSGSKSYFAADYGNVHLISLDSQGLENGQYRLYDTTGTQVQWLKRDLEANKLPWTIVIFHHPPYSKGSHNSDTEEQMKLIRQSLTPILERYGVDLVLSGHSHGYERYYRLKDMRGLANTFDKTVHIAENTIARYDGSPNSCPILTKGKGTVYVVNGSGGALGGQSSDYPHPAMIYGNTIVGGSMILDVNDNRLDAQFLLNDGSVPDRFTIMKNVNKSTMLTTEFADTISLNASWPGDYRWPDGQTSRSIRYVANKAGTYPITVNDARQCLTDLFTLTVPQPPKVTTKTVAAVCAGGSVTVTAVPENTTKAAGWQYDVLLSDAAGNFTTETVVGTGSLAGLRATIPTSVSAGTGYRLQVRPRGILYAQVVASDTFTIKSAPTATLSGSATVTPGQSASVTLSFTGEGPWRGNLSDGTSFSATTSPVTVVVQPMASGSLTVTKIENDCGPGTATGQANLIVLLPTEVNEFPGGQLRVYPNPTHDVVYVELLTSQKKAVSLTLKNLQGQSVFQKEFNPTSTLTEAVPMPAATGMYLLTVQVGQETITRKVLRQ